jgi:hypothetical protein
MSWSWGVRRDVTPELAAAVLFLCAAVSIACTVLATAGVLSWDIPVELAAAEASPLVFLCACVVVFFRPPIGYGLGLIAGIVFLPWFIRIEFSPAWWNSWVYFNYGSPTPEEEAVPTFVKLRILSAALVVITIACSSIRLLPAQWSLRGSPLCRRTGPLSQLPFSCWLSGSSTQSRLTRSPASLTERRRISASYMYRSVDYASTKPRWMSLGTGEYGLSGMTEGCFSIVLKGEFPLLVWAKRR